MTVGRRTTAIAALASATVLGGCGLSDRVGGVGAEPSVVSTSVSTTAGSPSDTPDAPSTGRSASAPAASPSTRSSSPSTTTGPAPEEFSVVTAGDVLVHHALQERAKALAGGQGYALGGMFTQVDDVIADADLAICNQETPISPDGRNLTAGPGVFVFNAPPQLAPALAGAGFDACTTASNHTLDQGLAGVAATRGVLKAAGVTPIGPVASADDAPGQPVMLRAGDATVGVLTYAYNVDNAATSASGPAEAPWMAENLWDAKGASGIIADARKAREKGADVVLVAMHWGLEYNSEPTTEQRTIAREVLRSGEVDGIMGSHAHVVQPCETIDGRTVAYGMGNFLSEQGPNRYPPKPIETQDGVLLRWTFTPTTEAGTTTWKQRVEYLPTFVTRPDYVIAPALGGDLGPSRERTSAAMMSLGKGACDATLLGASDTAG